MQDDNERMIEEMTGIKVLAKVQKGDTELNMAVSCLQSLYE